MYSDIMLFMGCGYMHAHITYTGNGVHGRRDRATIIAAIYYGLKESNHSDVSSLKSEQRLAFATILKGNDSVMVLRAAASS